LWSSVMIHSHSSMDDPKASTLEILARFSIRCPVLRNVTPRHQGSLTRPTQINY
jgi:hypothetical protein